MVFSHTNHLYVIQSSGGRVYDASADPNSVTIKSFPLPSMIGGYHTTMPDTISIYRVTTCISILPAPDESQILIQTWNDIQVWSLRQLTDVPDTRDDIMNINLSGDASLLALATPTDIEIWDAQIGQHLHVI